MILLVVLGVLCLAASWDMWDVIIANGDVREVDWSTQVPLAVLGVVFLVLGVAMRKRR